MAATTLWIGTATTVVPRLRKSDDRNFLRPPLYYCQMAKRVNEAGVKYVLFDPQRVLWDVKRIDGWTPVDPARTLGPWHRVRTPLPDAVYENVFVHLAMKGYCSQLRRMSKVYGIPLFNPPLPDKWRVLRLLETADVRAYIPETTRLRDVDRAVAVIDKWRVAYVKPIGGYGGMGVTRVEKQTDGDYRVSLDRTQTRVHSSRRTLAAAQLRDWLRQRMHHPYLVQQGIPLMTLDGRKVEFRVVCQRDLRGRWQVVGVVPKLVAQGGVVSNIIAGGSRLSLDDCQALARRLGKSVPVTELHRCATTLAQAIGRGRPHAGIIGFDLGVEEGGRVWMIEANPKPARSLLDEAQRRRSAELSADFALYLARRR